MEVALLLPAVGAVIGWRVSPRDRALRLAAIVGGVVLALGFLFWIVIRPSSAVEPTGENISGYVFGSAIWLGITLLLTWGTNRLRHR